MKWFWVFLLVSFSAHANDQQYAKGKEMAQKLNPKSLQDLKGVEVVPNYKGAQVPEASYGEGGLKERARQELAACRRAPKGQCSKGTGLAAHTFQKSYYDTDEVIITKDNPIIKKSDEAVKDPLKTLKATQASTRVETHVENRRETCREPAQVFSLEGSSTLAGVPLLQKKREFKALESYCQSSRPKWRHIVKKDVLAELDAHPNLCKLAGVHNMEIIWNNVPQACPNLLTIYPFLTIAERKKYDHHTTRYRHLYDDSVFSGWNFNLSPNKAPDFPDEGWQRFTNVGFDGNLRGHWQRNGTIYEDLPAERDPYLWNKVSYDYFERAMVHPVGASFQALDDTPWETSTKASYAKGQEAGKEEQDVWLGDARLEGLVDEGICEYADARCVQGPATRTIGGVKVFRKCWAKKQTFKCRYNGPDTCTLLRQKGCQQLSSKCLKKMGSHCLYYEKIFNCRTMTKRVVGGGMNGKLPYCLDGNCSKMIIVPNQDMMEVLSKLDVFRKIAQNMDKDSMTVFKGTDQRCSRHCINFSSCCRVSGGGWGVALGLSKCSEDEKVLARKRGENKCVNIGTYCAEKVLGVCIRKKTTFCCFDTKMARTFHEQARRQLGLGWGGAQNPKCEGLTLDQLSRLDFSKMDFSEIFSELMPKVKPRQEGALNKLMKADWTARLPDAKQDENSLDVGEDAKKRQEAVKKKPQDYRNGKNPKNFTQHHEYESRDWMAEETPHHEVQKKQEGKLVY